MCGGFSLSGGKEEGWQGAKHSAAENRDNQHDTHDDARSIKIVRGVWGEGGVSEGLFAALRRQEGLAAHRAKVLIA